MRCKTKMELAVGKRSGKPHLWVEEESRSGSHVFVLQDLEWIIHLSLLNPADVKLLSVLTCNQHYNYRER